jgi:hypothetical protein
MLHPLYPTVLGHPELLAEHLGNYGALLRQESQEAGRSLIARLVAALLAAVSAMLALGLVGVAVMLGALHGSFHWVLAAVPGVALLIALISGFLAARPHPLHAFDDLRTQFEADLRALRKAGERDGD